MIIKDGRFGAYVTDGETNATLRRGDEIETITAERAAELLAEKRAKGPAPKKKAGGAKARGRGEEDGQQRNGLGPKARGEEGRLAPALIRGLKSRTRKAADSPEVGGFRHGQGQEAQAWQGARHRLAVPAAPTQQASLANRPPGQRFYDLPYSAAAPRLINPDLGLHNLVARAGHNAAYEIDVTLLDAPDHRLIRSGVLLAHRVLDGRGEWYLTAPDWQPLLPKDRIELMGHADLPEELRRPAPAAAPPGHARPGRRAQLRPARVRAARRPRHHAGPAPRRQGDRTPRRPDHRPLPRGDDHPGRSRTHRRAGRLAGPGVHPGRARRTCPGSPGWSPGSAPRPPGRPTCRCPEPFDADGPFKKFVSQLLALRLRRIVEADLAIRGGDQTRDRPAGRRGGPAAGRAHGLSPVLDAEWVEDLYDELGWISLDSAPSDSERPGAAGRPAAQRALPHRAGAAGRCGPRAEARRGAGRADRRGADAS